MFVEVRYKTSPHSPVHLAIVNTDLITMLQHSDYKVAVKGGRTLYLTKQSFEELVEIIKGLVEDSWNTL